MACWFSRRSGSRVSIFKTVRRVLRALSLSRNPMPPRTTRKSDRRKVSDRTMVGTTQPLCLSASGTDGRRYDSTMNLRERKTHSVSLHYWGWTSNTLCFAVAGEVFVLTSPFIERCQLNRSMQHLITTCYDSTSFQDSISSVALNQNLNRAFVLFELTPGIEIGLPGRNKKLLSGCCNDPLRPPE